MGKSTLFNRLTRSRRAIVTAIPGTTRDIITLPMEWEAVAFSVTDTGGMFGASEDPLHALVFEQGQRALAAADVLIIVVDGREGLVPGDHDVVTAARATGRPVLLVVNKTDDRRARAGVVEFYQLGIEPVFEISAEHGDGVGDLLDGLMVHLGPAAAGTAVRVAEGDEDAVTLEDAPDVDPGPEAPREIAVAIAGRPNAGKSSLVNRLLREERMIVSDVPGTTRDAVDSIMTWHRRQFRIVDTAGIRRPGRVARGGQVESVSVLLSRRAIEGADIVVLLIDASAGATDQDAAIAGEADKAGRGIIIVANKWDLMKDRGPDFVRTFDEQVRRQLKFLEYAPVLHLSARTGERTGKLLEAIDRVAAARSYRVKTPELNRFVKEVTAAHPPASPGRRHVRVLYAAQTDVAPPTFVFFTNVGTSFHFSYERFLVNKLRERFGFEGSPIRLHVRPRTRATGAAPAPAPRRSG